MAKEQNGTQQVATIPDAKNYNLDKPEDLKAFLGAVESVDETQLQKVSSRLYKSLDLNTTYAFWITGISKQTFKDDDGSERTTDCVEFTTKEGQECLNADTLFTQGVLKLIGESKEFPYAAKVVVGGLTGKDKKRQFKDIGLFVL